MDVNDEFPEFKGLPYAVGIHEASRFLFDKYYVYTCRRFIQL